MSNLKYSFIKEQSTDGRFVFRCETSSFGLDNVTDKDIVSFYKSFSKMSYFDSGLLPVSGNGLLSVRSASNHTQFVYQHAPSINFINWGSYEGDSSAVAYYVAQPYRIVIADILNDNFYGARIFYSPYPITNPDSQLYHVNLPNINCRGYRGNGVGWVCLYHTTDITSFPFNEKVYHILERCSGIEAYNDQNMSETDGPRFYASHYNNDSSYSHLWDPNQWQKYSEENGYEWTLDPDLWIPVMVTDIDMQGHHDPSGVPLTISMAMLGNYQAYYSDSLIPKPVNAIARFPESFTNESVENIFKRAFNSSSTENTNTNVYSDSLNIKLNISSNPLISGKLHQEEDSEAFTCYKCETTFNSEFHESYTDPANGDDYCQSCWEDSFVYSEVHNDYLNLNHENLACDPYSEEYFLPDHIDHDYCRKCYSYYAIPMYFPSDKKTLPIYHKLDEDNQPIDDDTVCYSCLSVLDLHTTCHKCTTTIPHPSNYEIKTIVDGVSSYYYCNICFHADHSF